MGLKNKIFHFNIAGEEFEIKASMNRLIGLKKVLGIGVADIFSKKFDWSDEENLRGLLAGCLYDDLKKEDHTRTPEDIAVIVGEMLDDECDLHPPEKLARRFAELGQTMMELYVMSKYHKTPQELREAVQKQIEAEEAEAASGKPQKKTTKKKAQRKSTGSRSSKIASISA